MTPSTCFVPSSYIYMKGGRSFAHFHFYLCGHITAEWLINMKVLFIASDNNCTSGAFLSMTKLNQILNNDFKIDTHIILPVKGDGIKLLDEARIPYTFIKSYNWVIPLCQRGTLKGWIKRWIYSIYNTFAIRKIAKIIEHNNFDLIHINTTYPYVGAISAIQTKKPFIWHLREYLEEDQRRCIWNTPNGYKLISQSNAVIAISSDLANKYTQLINSSNLFVVLNGIDITQFYKPYHKIFQDQCITLVYGGGYSVMKGIYELASALSLLSSSNICNFKVWFLGKAPEKFTKYIYDIGLDDKCMFLGYQKDVSMWYEKADIAFTCSACEGFGRKTVEAMLGGALVIGADTGGTLDIISHQQTGLLYKQGDALDLFNKCVYAIENKEKASEIAQNGQKFAFEKLSAKKNAESIVDIYKNVLKNTEDKTISI